MVENIFARPVFQEFILPFLLVFTVVFALLDKTKILGEGKRQINAIVALVIGLMVISFSYATGVISELMPFLAVGIVIIFVFMVLWGFVASGKEGLSLNKGLKITFGILIGIAIIGAVLFATDSWDFVYSNLIKGESASAIWTNVLFIALVAGAIALVLASKGKGDKE